VALAVMALLAGTVLMASVSIMIAIPLIALIRIGQGGTGDRQPVELTRALSVRIGWAAVMAVMFGVGAWIFRARIEAFLSGADFSAYARVVAPMKLVREVFAESPLFGVGLGGKELVEAKLVAILSEGTVASIEYLAANVFSYWSSALGEIFIFLGGLGTLAFVTLVGALGARGLGVRPLATVGIFLVIAAADSAFVSFRIWSYAGCLVGAATSLRGFRLVAVGPGARGDSGMGIGKEDLAGVTR
jgi:hypothetical protein